MAFQQNQDRVHIADRGNLSDPKQSAGFIVDPMLEPTSVSSAPHPIHPDVNSIDNPEKFDPSTGHQNTHYHPDKKLSKKKQAKKLGVGNVHPTSHAVPHYSADSFTAHEKEAHERQEKRDETLLAREQHHDEEDEEDDDDDDNDDTHSRTEATIQSKQQHHSERTTGHESEKGMGTSTTHSKSTSVTDKSIKEKDNANDKNVSNKEKEGDKDKESSDAQPSLLSRATATATGLASTVMNAPIVTSIMSKVGLGGKSDAEKSEGGDSSKPTTNEEVAEAGK